MTWCATYTGKKFDYKNLNRDNICIEDIAHALSQICRFGGHCNRFYSVAEHSVLLCRFFERQDKDELAKYALLHDAAEAYVGDMVYPLRCVMPMEHKKLETTILNLIMSKYGVSFSGDAASAVEEINMADKRLTQAEARELNSRWNVDEWHPQGLHPLSVNIKCWGPFQAKDRFLEAFKQLFTW